jgi:hypothetical protein
VRAYLGQGWRITRMLRHVSAPRLHCGLELERKHLGLSVPRISVRSLRKSSKRSGKHGSGTCRQNGMTQSDAAFWMAVIGTACWGVCFWWMKRISAEQCRLMDQLREQGWRIEQLSTIEHDLIKEVHPQVGEIKEGMGEMIAVVKENSEEMIAAVKESAEGVSPAPLGGLREPPNGVHNPGNQREPSRSS